MGSIDARVSMRATTRPVNNIEKVSERVRRMINSTYVTLDGVIKNPQDWPSPGGFSDQGSTPRC
jgi:hypothetical protein